MGIVTIAILQLPEETEQYLWVLDCGFSHTMHTCFIRWWYAKRSASACEQKSMTVLVSQSLPHTQRKTLVETGLCHAICTLNIQRRTQVLLAFFYSFGTLFFGRAPLHLSHSIFFGVCAFFFTVLHHPKPILIPRLSNTNTSVTPLCVSHRCTDYGLTCSNLGMLGDIV